MSLRRVWAAFWSALALSLVLASLYLGWRILAAADFGYPVLYELLDIERTVATYGPRNKQRPGFHTTSEAERERIFAAIAESVRSGGRGLEGITYTLPGGRTVPALTAPEIRHLRDVAALVRAFERAGLFATSATLALYALAWTRRRCAPSTTHFLFGLSTVTGAAVLAVLGVGPVRVFYWLHERLFPPDHPWFFWYEESLMSMMMQAPNLFGAIAIAWLVLALAIAAGAWALGRRVLARRVA